MKKQIIMLLMLFTFNIKYSFGEFDIVGEFNGSYRFQNSKDNVFDYDYIFSGEYYNKNLYSNIALNLTDDNDKFLEIDKLFVELYKDDLIATVGRQPIYWGSSYIFNGANIFNPIDLEKPEEEKNGTDALTLRYDINDTSRLEGLLFKNDEVDDNFGFRYTFLVDQFEFMANYFNYKSFDKEKVKNNDVVLEFKGDVGVGLWGQYVYRDRNGEVYDTYVLGSDYSFSIKDKPLYTLVEGMYNHKTKDKNLYVTYQYQLFDYISFSQSALLDTKDSYFINSNIEYQYNDNTTLEFGYNYYNNFNNRVDNDIEDEIYVKMNTFF